MMHGPKSSVLARFVHRLTNLLKILAITHTAASFDNRLNTYTPAKRPWQQAKRIMKPGQNQFVI